MSSTAVLELILAQLYVFSCLWLSLKWKVRLKSPRKLYKDSWMQVFQGCGLKNIYPLYMLLDISLKVLESTSSCSYSISFCCHVKTEQNMLNTSGYATELYIIYVEMDLCHSYISSIPLLYFSSLIYRFSPCIIITFSTNLLLFVVY